MSTNSNSWKFFKIICILQMVLVAFQGMLAVSGLLSGKNLVLHSLELLVYTILFVFLYHGLSILNYNFPNIPLSQRQKRAFNSLYVINFLLIAFLFARVVNTWWLVPVMFETGTGITVVNWFYFIVSAVFSWLVFGIHLIFLVGMFKLRRQIHQNTIDTWYQQFENKNE